MPSFWPFRRRSSALKGESHPSAGAMTASTAPIATPMATPFRRPSRRRSQGRRRVSQQEKISEAQSPPSNKRQGSAENEKMPLRRGSVESDITALPVSRRLQSSPHLRPVDSQRPHIPYNFRPYSDSQTSIPRQGDKSSRPQTLKSKRSTYSSTRPERRRSSKKRKDDNALREEEIRALSAPIPIPKRPGEGPLRRDSKKMKSNVSLPPEDSIHSSMSGVMEQRGWEVGSIDIFNPRPAVRLSGTPQYVTAGSVGPSPLPRKSSDRTRNKTPVTRDTARKRQTIGNQANELDASDIRMLMERDTKRRERRKKEQQEKLDRKLRNRQGRNRGDSDRKRREAEEARREAEAKRHAEETQLTRELETPPQDVHPALRDRPAEPAADIVGLGMGVATAAGGPIDPEHMHAHAIPTTEERGTENTGTYLKYRQEAVPENPFQDPSQPPTPVERDVEALRMPTMPGAFTPLASPTEDPMAHAAQAVPSLQTATPPLSPIRTNPTERVPSRLSTRSDLPSPPPIPTDRRDSEPKERRAGGWATLFRRGGTFKKPGDGGRASPSEFSFSNTSRESMRNQPLPAHLVDLQQTPRSRSAGGAPMRAKSKFREDLPEMPISPPDSRMPSPDVTSAAAAAIAARRTRKSPMPVDIPGARPRDSDVDSSTIGRNDTPISPYVRAHGLMSASLASVDSEGSWLASSGKRQSMQSGLSREMGSLSRRKPEFNASYEELGGDKDAEYFHRTTPSPALHNRRISSQVMAEAGAGADDESDYGEGPSTESPADPLTVHGSVRRKPTLVHRDPRVKSREGLLAEYSTGVETPEAAESPDGDDFDLGSESEVRSARSVNYGKHHARQMSAGSAKLLDIPPSTRQSMQAHSRESMDSSAAAPPASRTSQL